MDTIIYRKSDRLIAGYVFPRRYPAQTRHAIEVEIINISLSELGGRPEDYGQVKVEQARRSGLLPVVDDNQNVSWVPNPRIVARDNIRASARTKLRGLGLTDDEIEAIIR